MRRGTLLLLLLATAGSFQVGFSPMTAPPLATAGLRNLDFKDVRCHAVAYPATTLVVHRRGARWRARATFVLCRHTKVEVYGWNGKSWYLQGIATLPTGGPVGALKSASLTRSDSPDFVVSVGGGADWTPFTVVARLHGRWQTVAFDGSRGNGGPRSRIIDAWTIVGGKVQGKMDSCGCAGGPETFTWYRFNGRMFAPTTPPGRTAACTAGAIDAAHALPGPPEIVGPLARLGAPFQLTRYACLDGWALARDSRGRFGLFEQTSTYGPFREPPQIWFRASVGTLDRIRGDARAFAIPASLRKRLEERLARTS